MFPQKLESSIAYDIARAMMDGFNRHYRLFCTESARAKHRFETADWHGQQRAQRERIEFYDLRVKECTMRLEKEFKAGEQSMDVWQQVKLVKQHDRVGRMADTLDYSEVAFPRERFSDDLIAEIGKFAQEQIERSVMEYGNAIKDLVAANIFPGDMLWKNVGVTRHGKVVFYDYDEIEYVTDCHFCRVPTPRNEEDEMSGEVWYSAGPRDVFPETFGPFLLGHAAVREVFMRHHADLLDAAFWQSCKERIQAGHVHDVLPYERDRRFIHMKEKTHV